jgi:hypothetical protein
MSSDNDSQIKELFHQLRKADEESAPSFSQALDARGRRQGLPGFWSFRLKLAMSLLAVIALIVPVLIHLNRDTVEPKEQIALDLMEWESPTDFLLTFSEDSLWTTLPTVDADLPEWVEEKYEE